MTNPNAPIILDTPEEINTYAFLMLRRAMVFRLKTGGSLLRNQELRMARNYGWSNARTVRKALEDMNTIAVNILGLDPILP